MVRQALRTSLRISCDIRQRIDKQQLIFPSAALRILDHHLHASGIIPTVSSSADVSGVSNNLSSIYEHDWFCVSQAVTCMECSSLLHASLQSELTSYVWVESVGNSSIRFGNVIWMKETIILAKAQRVFVRKQKGGKKSAPFSDDERDRFHAMDNLMKGFELPEPLFVETSKHHINEDDNSSPILTTQVGPQHVNFGKHADHAFLLETAMHALYLANNDSTNLLNSIAIQYIAEVYEGEQLNCVVSKDEQQVFIMKQSSLNGEQKFAAIAKVLN